MSLTTRSKKEALRYTGWSEGFFDQVARKYKLGPCKGCYSFERMREVNRVLCERKDEGAPTEKRAVGGKRVPGRKAKELLRLDQRAG